ncbi:hypothetical protein [Phyllobacterium sp. SB3]|uniref:hypothetical protein n=1 Tax=Phyllobacterium sp. SB3 TaxID=3156073 RepID=UPI0032B0006D
MSKSSKTEQTNEPPSWAKPLLKEAAAEGMDLYKRGIGYTPYTGPTRTGFSDVSLGGMNDALKATGYTGPAVSNETWQNAPGIAEARQAIEALKAKRAEQTSPRDLTPQVVEGPNEKRERLLWEARHGEGTWAAEKARREDEAYKRQPRMSGR